MSTTRTVSATALHHYQGLNFAFPLFGVASLLDGVAFPLFGVAFPLFGVTLLREGSLLAGVVLLLFGVAVLLSGVSVLLPQRSSQGAFDWRRIWTELTRPRK